MARVTVEDCIDKVDSPYELVLVAKERATQLNSGIEPSVDRDNDKNTVIALREIAVENVKVNELTDSAVYKLRKHIGSIKALTTALMVFSTAFGTAVFGLLIDKGFSIEQISMISGTYIFLALIALFFVRNKLNPIKI